MVAAWSRRRYYACEIATLLAGALIPVVNVVWTAKDSWVAQVLSAVLGATVTIATGIAKLFKFQENWLQYRSIAEALGRERELYLGNVGDYGASAPIASLCSSSALKLCCRRALRKSSPRNRRKPKAGAKSRAAATSRVLKKWGSAG